jgi:hypothetical protein
MPCESFDFFTVPAQIFGSKVKYTTVYHNCVQVEHETLLEMSLIAFDF